MKILFIVVNYFTNKEIKNYYDNLLKKVNKDNFDFIIVDNSENEEEYLEIENNFKEKNIFIYRNKNNGYLPGCNYGLLEYLKIRNMPEWIIICNSDIDIETENLYEELKLLSQKEDLGTIAPKIINLRNENQNPFSEKRISKKRLIFMKMIYSHNLLLNVFLKINLLRKKTKIKLDIKEKKIYAPHGSFMIFSKRYLEKGGSFNFKSFLYGEENFIGEQNLNLNLEVWYYPKIKIIHKENVTTSKLVTNFKRKCIVDSLNYILKEFYKKK